MLVGKTGEATGRPRRQNSSREIIVKFHSHGARLQLLKGRAKLREERANIYINEDLTKSRRTIFYRVRTDLEKSLKMTLVLENSWNYKKVQFVLELSLNFEKNSLIITKSP